MPFWKLNIYLVSYDHLPSGWAYLPATIEIAPSKNSQSLKDWRPGLAFNGLKTLFF